MTFRHLIRALRLPFATASALPYCHGALAASGRLDLAPFALGLGVVVFTHLSANVANDYADSVSGADDVDPRHFGFFGGAQLIQEGVLSRNQTGNLALLLAATSWGFVLGLSLLVGSPWIIVLYAGLLGLAWAYSCRPLALSYRGCGEAVVFLLFGPATFWGGWFLQTGSLPGGTGLLLSMVHGALVAAVLVGNEVADAQPDRVAGKMTMVVRVGARNGWLLSALLAFGALGVIVWLLCQGRVHWPTALIAVMGSATACALSVRQLRRFHDQRECLTTASKLAIAAHTWTSLWLMAGAWA